MRQATSGGKGMGRVARVGRWVAGGVLCAAAAVASELPLAPAPHPVTPEEVEVAPAPHAVPEGAVAPPPHARPTLAVAPPSVPALPIPVRPVAAVSTAEPPVALAPVV